MDQPRELSFEQSLELAMKQVPSPIRKMFQMDTIPTVSRELMQKYGLHIDQGTVLEREIMLLLLGVKNPTEFVATLEEEARLPKETITNIANDVNDKIFLPLREEMRSGAPPPRPNVSVPRYAPPQNPSQAAPLPVRPAPAQPQQAAARAMPAARLPITDPERELPAGEPAPPPTPSFTSAPVSAPRSFAEPAPASSSPAHPSSAPLPPRAVLPGASQGAAPPAPAMLRPQPQTPRAPAQSAPPSNLPGVLAPKQPLAPTASPSAADPYREPVDER